MLDDELAVVGSHLAVMLPGNRIGGGFSARRRPLQLDVAYVYGLGKARIGDLFGHTSHSVLATLTFDMTWRPAPAGVAAPPPAATPR